MMTHHRSTLDHFLVHGDCLRRLGIHDFPDGTLLWAFAMMEATDP